MLNKAVLLQFVIGSSLAFAATGAVDASGGRENSSLAAARSVADSSVTDLARLEPSALSAYPNGAKRIGKTLVVTTGVAGRVKFEDSPDCDVPDHEERCVRNIYVSHLKRQRKSLIAKLYYESASYLLVDDDDGQSTELSAFPIFSPTGKYLLLIADANDDIHAPLEIWKRSNRIYALDWSLKEYRSAIYTSYKLMSWPEDCKLLIRYSITTELNKPETVGSHLLTCKKAGGWVTMTTK